MKMESREAERAELMAHSWEKVRDKESPKELVE